MLYKLLKEKEGIHLKKLIIAIFMISILLAGCGDTSQKNNNKNQDEVPVMIEANLNVPEKGEIGEEVALAVTVTQGKNFVEDANEVKFEIWKEGEKNTSEIVEANHSEKGKYISSYKFLENGLYHVQSHVTARNMHTMPEISIQIGDEEAHHEHAEGGGEHSHHHDNDVKIHLDTPNQMITTEPTSLSVQIESQQQPLTKASVRLEIFQDASNPAWVDTVEAANGEYKANYQFPSSGNYTIRIHVTNDEGLHEHTEVEVNVH